MFANERLKFQKRSQKALELASKEQATQRAVSSIEVRPPQKQY